LRIATVDTHTAGESLRIILGGMSLPDSATMLERRRVAVSGIASAASHCSSHAVNNSAMPTLTVVFAMTADTACQPLTRLA